MIYYHNDFIGVFENVLTKDECQDIINYFDNSEKIGDVWSRQLSENKIAKTKKNDSTCFIDFRKEYCFTGAPFINMINEKVYECYLLYKETYDILSSVEEHILTPSIRIQKTQVGGGYHLWHCEHGSIQVGSRLLAWTIYLNDVHEGGETEFLYQHMRVPSKQGSVCIFPSGFTHAHRGNPPLSNDKYIITSWIEYIK
jgi:hypothetical protein